MKREIKFRAWDKLVKKMVQPRDGDFIGWHSPTNWKECYEIMQYTGLKDKNGNEIYEGDILNVIEKQDYSKKKEYKGHVVFSDTAMFAVKVGVKDMNIKALMDYHLIEIIGNIYDNPDLIL